MADNTYRKLVIAEVYNQGVAKPQSIIAKDDSVGVHCDGGSYLQIFATTEISEVSLLEPFTRLGLQTFQPSSSSIMHTTIRACALNIQLLLGSHYCKTRNHLTLILFSFHLSLQNSFPLFLQSLHESKPTEQHCLSTMRHYHNIQYM